MIKKDKNFIDIKCSRIKNTVMCWYIAGIFFSIILIVLIWDSCESGHVVMQWLYIILGIIMGSIIVNIVIIFLSSSIIIKDHEIAKLTSEGVKFRIKCSDIVEICYFSNPRYYWILFVFIPIFTIAFCIDNNYLFGVCSIRFYNSDSPNNILELDKICTLTPDEQAKGLHEWIENIGRKDVKRIADKIGLTVRYIKEK